MNTILEHSQKVQSEYCICGHDRIRHIQGKCHGSLNYEKDGSVTQRNLLCDCKGVSSEKAIDR